MTTRSQTLLGIFETPGSAAEAVQAVGAEGDFGLEIYTPVPHEHLLALAPKRARPVRYFALIGGVSGIAAGFALAIVSALLYRLVVNGMVEPTVVPAVVPGFEGTILLAGLATMLGLLIGCWLPQITPRKVWDERLSETHYGVELHCDPDDADRLVALLEKNGAVDVHRG